MKKCIFCGQEFEELSEEHIIPNVICGRIKSKNLICKNCNSWLGENIDKELENIYSQIIVMFRIKRERGTPQPVKVIDAKTKQEYLYGYNGSYELADTYIEETHSQKNSFIFKMQSNPKNKKQVKNKIGQLLAKKKDELESLGIDYKNEIVKQHKTIDDNWENTRKNTKKFKPSAILLQFNFGGKGAALAILKIAYLFFKDVKPNVKVDDEDIIHILKNLSNDVFKRCFSYSLENDLFEEIPLEISHFIFIRGSRKENKIVAYIKLFSVSPYVCVLNDKYQGEDFSISYGYNLLSQQAFSPKCNQIDRLNDLPSLLDYKKNYNIASKNIHKDLSRIMELYYKIYPTAKYNELQLDLYNRFKEVVGENFIKSEIFDSIINTFKFEYDYEEGISESRKKECVELIVNYIIGMLNISLQNKRND